MKALKISNKIPNPEKDGVADLEAEHSSLKQIVSLWSKKSTMIHITITPISNKVHLTIPNEYIGKKVQVLLYTLEEAEPKDSAIKHRKKPSDYAGTLSTKEADKFLKYIEQSRNEWERDI